MWINNSKLHFPWIWSHLLKKFSMENFIFCAVLKAIFKGNCSKQDKVTFTRRNKVNLFIVYELDT